MEYKLVQFSMCVAIFICLFYLSSPINEISLKLFVKFITSLTFSLAFQTNYKNQLRIYNMVSVLQLLLNFINETFEYKLLDLLAGDTILI
jgi:hypothetical protein